jgi:hypothetical protein
MAGTKAGGRKAQATLIAKLGEEGAHRARVEQGRKGGKISRGGGFASMAREKVRAMGRKGGSSPRMTKKDKEYEYYVKDDSSDGNVSTGDLLDEKG